ncbi:MAG: adenylate/guanylate cyclase domain-containing protein [Enhydrobacter sp.]|nr:MAG: adenylate/guanylate cyclase domain-containing protein [Enhydrobacter sp.]
MATTQRRLAAIVHADLAGFTRMMEGAETRTFRHLKAAQIDVWRPAIQVGGGRLVGTAGDAMLAEFGSAVSAVAAAIDIQERMARFNDTLSEEQRMLFRVGVHLGEVIVDEEDQNIFGDGVNLAARIQAMAEPGGIAVSRAVRDVAELKVEYAFVDGGEHQLKNVSRPVQIYHIRVVREASVKTTTKVLPQINLRFEGVDSIGQKFGFDVPLDKLMTAAQGMVIGRSPDQCDLVVGHATVSRRHARLTLAGGEALKIEDLGSTNGTAVNGAAVPAGAALPLQTGAKVKVGDVELVIRQL